MLVALLCVLAISLLAVLSLIAALLVGGASESGSDAEQGVQVDAGPATNIVDSEATVPALTATTGSETFTTSLGGGDPATLWSDGAAQGE